MRSRTVAFVVFDGVKGLDAFGPADVFYFANYFAERSGADRAPYRVEIVAAKPGPIRTASGPSMIAERSADDPGLSPDVLLVAGGLRIGEAAADPGFLRDLSALAERSFIAWYLWVGRVLLGS